MSFIVRLFPLWAVTLAIVAFNVPAPFVELKPKIVPLLSIVMLGMGMTLTWEHFLSALNKPKVICLTTFMQYLIMPLIAWLLSKLFDLSTAHLIGMVLVGSSAGGTASNVICYLAKGDVALSILLTMVSTLVAIVAMPSLIYLYLHQTVPVPFLAMLTSILQMVLFPVLIGTAINSTFRSQVDKIRSILPLISVAAIVVIIAIIVAVNQQDLAQTGSVIALAVVLHNLLGLCTGYYIPRLFGYDEKTCRTISIEVGMQNSGLSVVLAVKYFSSMAALPGAIFSIWHNISGSVLAGYWGKNADDKL